MNVFSVILNFTYMILGVEPIQRFPEALSSEEEKKCFDEYRAGSESARDKLIEHNLRLVVHVIKKYQSSGFDKEDLQSIGTIGLVKAVDSYNSSSGTRFATYAVKCIQNEIFMFFRNQKKYGCEVSLNDVVDVDKDGNSLTYMDIIFLEDTIADDLDKKIKINKALEYIKAELDERERQILVMRYGLGNTKAYTQREVAKMLGISRSYVSRIEKASLEKINKYLHSS